MKIRQEVITAAILLALVSAVWARPGSASARCPRIALRTLVLTLDGVPGETSAFTKASDAGDGEFRATLDSILDAAINGFLDLRGGPGRRIDDSLIYPSSVILPGATKTSILIPQGEGNPSLRSEFYSGKDMAAAKRSYDTLVAQLKPALTKWESGETLDKGSAAIRRYHFENAEKDLSVAVRLYSYESTGTVEVVLTIRGPAR